MHALLQSAGISCNEQGVRVRSASESLSLESLSRSVEGRANKSTAVVVTTAYLSDEWTHQLNCHCHLVIVLLVRAQQHVDQRGALISE